MYYRDMVQLLCQFMSAWAELGIPSVPVLNQCGHRRDGPGNHGPVDRRPPLIFEVPPHLWNDGSADYHALCPLISTQAGVEIRISGSVVLRRASIAVSCLYHATI